MELLDKNYSITYYFNRLSDLNVYHFYWEKECIYIILLNPNIFNHLEIYFVL